MCRLAMTQKDLLKMLDYFDSLSMWSFSLGHIKMYFKDNDEKSIRVMLNRHCKNGIITQCVRGIYVNPRGKKPLFYLEALASTIRDNATFYLSLETLLSELGLISQMPNRMTFVSKGRSQTFFTPYGIIEFVHSSRSAQGFLNNCFFDKDRNIYIASQQQAISDIYRHNRSVDLYEEQLRKEQL